LRDHARVNHPNGLRVAVLSCGDLGAEVAAALRALPGVSAVALVTAPYARRRLSVADKVRRVYRTQGPLGLLAVLAAKLGAGRRSFESVQREPPQPSLPPADVPHYQFPDLHDAACLAALARFRPDLGVVAGTYVLRESVFAIPRLGSINLHSGRAPEYRGAAPAFWELYNGERQVGVTIHRVATTLDAGDILLQETFPLDPAPAGDPLEYLERYRAAVLRPNGVRLLAQAVAQIAAGRAQPRAQDASRARTYRTPDYRAVRELRRRVRARRGMAAGRRGTVAKRRLKVLLGRFFFWSGLYRVLLRRKAVIALFHRVDDELAGNPISCTRADFEAYCRFFGRYFRVVSLETLLARLRRGEDVDRHLVITFDDGYKDNRDVAARELQRHGLTACFFIATELIGSSRVPPWDAELGIASRWMSWDDVRELRARGFEIGAHTMNHVDLGAVHGTDAAREIVGSRQRIREEVGIHTPFFSYPFGRADQITEENRGVVRQVGFETCLSAYGGIVRPGSDPFDLKRIAVSPWYISPYQFGFEVMLTGD
jgi:peptidoglycan/xylan/chitin deacetylase (PgdA/CDA1 family)/folate-dependent phosphoribosylglycinamide formyltransferase PurN